MFKPSIVFLSSAFVLLFCFTAISKDDEQVITSPAGFSASWTNTEEAHSVLTLTKDGKVVATIDGARPVSFSPDGKVLLVREAQADDDCRHYLLNLAKGEYRKEWISGKELRIGGRFVVETNWSADGKTITLKNAEFIGGSETIDVAKHCRQ